jgi:alanine dehydrogenase
MSNHFTIGLATMHVEPGEVRAFLPDFVSDLENFGAKVFLEHGYGSGMSITQEDYLQKAPGTAFASLQEVYRQDYVLVLRYPNDEDIKLMHPGGCLISMVHYPTRPGRVDLFRALGISSISLDSIKDDTGRRMIENLRAVAWNGINIAFEVLQSTYPDPGFDSPERPQIQVTLLGAGAVGTHVVQAAVQYGEPSQRAIMFSAGIPGVQVTVIDYDITSHKAIMRDILSRTDILVDATQRLEASKPVIPNSWLSILPTHAIITDLAVDPYTLDTNPPVVRGIEGIPQGNLDKYIFPADDPDWDQTVPVSIPSEHRRTTVSCYSWPGIRPKECMTHYGEQLKPLMEVLINKGYENLNLQGGFFERALYRASLGGWS